MTKNEILHIKRVLECIRDKDGHVIKAIAFCDKQLKIFESMRGQLKELYEDYRWNY